MTLMCECTFWDVEDNIKVQYIFGLLKVWEWMRDSCFNNQQPHLNLLKTDVSIEYNKLMMSHDYIIVIRSPHTVLFYVTLCSLVFYKWNWFLVFFCNGSIFACHKLYFPLSVCKLEKCWSGFKIYITYIGTKPFLETTLNLALLYVFEDFKCVCYVLN